MSIIIKLLLFFIGLILSINGLSQSLENGGLEGPANMSYAPPGWEVVPHTDPNCDAVLYSGATPDVFTFDAPATWYGWYGNPHEGLSFVSGLYTLGNHEGIQQVVSGFSVGAEYTISFWQALVKQETAPLLDTSASWAVYLDNDLVGVSEVSQSLVAPPIGTDLVWEYRFITFTATSEVHTLKFLPADDDPDQSYADASLSGAVRMGLDDITLNQGNSAGVNTLNNTDDPELIGIFDTLGREAKDEPNTLLIYVYSDGTKKKVFRIE